MVQPSAMNRAQRRTANSVAPYGYNRKGQVRVVARGTGAKKVFGMVNIPLAIYNAVKTGQQNKAARAAASKPQVVQVAPSGTQGFD